MSFHLVSSSQGSTTFDQQCFTVYNFESESDKRVTTVRPNANGNESPQMTSLAAETIPNPNKKPSYQRSLLSTVFCFIQGLDITCTASEKLKWFPEFTSTAAYLACLALCKGDTSTV
eukprot:3354121-Amphidinium_carterae.1